jgi:hypothetical protein
MLPKHNIRSTRSLTLEISRKFLARLPVVDAIAEGVKHKVFGPAEGI